MRIFAFSLSLLLTAAVHADERRVKIAVLDLVAKGVAVDLAASETGLLAQELDELQIFKVLSREDIKNMLRFEQDKQRLGCDGSGACAAELGSALNVEYLVAGSLGKLGDTWVLNLTLSNVHDGSVEGRVTENVKGKEDVLIAAVKRNVKVLVGKVLTDRQGFLILGSPELGATVKIDGVVKGSTPIRGKLPLAWGPHLLQVEKAGFVAYEEDIQIPAKQLLVKDIAMVPSPDFLSTYETSAKKFRLGAYLSTAVAAAGIGGAVYFNYAAGKREATLQSDYVPRLTAGDETARHDAQTIANQGATYVLVSRAALGVGVASAALATYFFIGGDDPGRYERYR